METGSLQFGPRNIEIIGFKDFNFDLKMSVSNFKKWDSVDTPSSESRVNERQKKYEF